MEIQLFDKYIKPVHVAINQKHAHLEVGQYSTK
jgi:hypothetical protein